MNIVSLLNNSSFGILSIKYYKNKIATSSYRLTDIYIWDVFNGFPIAVLENNEAIYGLAFSNDGEYLFSGSITGKIKKWDIENSSLASESQGHSSCVYCIEYGDKYFLTGSMDKKVKMWNDNCILLKEFEVGFSVCFLYLSVDCGKFGVLGWNSKVKIWDINKNKNIQIEDENNSFLRLFFCPNGKYIATTHYYNIIKIWKIDCEENVKDYYFIYEKNNITDISWEKCKISDEYKNTIYDIFVKIFPEEIIEKIINIMCNKYALLLKDEILFCEQ